METRLGLRKICKAIDELAATTATQNSSRKDMRETRASAAAAATTTAPTSAPSKPEEKKAIRVTRAASSRPKLNKKKSSSSMTRKATRSKVIKPRKTQREEEVMEEEEEENNNMTDSASIAIALGQEEEATLGNTSPEQMAFYQEPATEESAENELFGPKLGGHVLWKMALDFKQPDGRVNTSKFLFRVTSFFSNTKARLLIRNFFIQKLKYKTNTKEEASYWRTCSSALKLISIGCYLESMFPADQLLAKHSCLCACFLVKRFFDYQPLSYRRIVALGNASSTQKAVGKGRIAVAEHFFTKILPAISLDLGREMFEFYSLPCTWPKGNKKKEILRFDITL